MTKDQIFNNIKFILFYLSILTFQTIIRYYISMFLFESSKDKELKRIIQTKFNEAITSEAKYEHNKGLLSSYCQNSDKKAIERLVDMIKQTIKDDQTKPKNKYFAIKMLQDVMKTQNKMLGNYVVKKILKRLAIFAAYKKENKDQNRGKSIFGSVKADQQNYAKKFHLTILSSLQEWGTTWPRGSDGPHLAFKQKYEQLVKQKITFPKISANPSQVLKEKLNKDKLDLKGLNQPKKLISPQRRESTERKDYTQYSSGNATKIIDRNKIAEINAFMVNIDDSFRLLQSMTEEAQIQLLSNVVDELYKELLKGEQLFNSLRLQNKKEYDPIINDVTLDFEFLEQIKYDLKKTKTPSEKKIFIKKYKEKFQERQQRRNQNELKESMTKRNSSDKNQQQQARNSINSKKSEQKSPNFYYPKIQNKKSSFSKDPGDSITVEDLQRRISKQKSKQQQKSEKSEISSEQNTAKFKTIRHQQLLHSPKQDIQKFSEKQKPQHDKLTPREAKSRNHSQSESQKSSSRSSENNQNRSQPKKQQPVTKNQQSVQNIHSTSIMKKFQSSNLINQSNSNQKQNNTNSYQSNSNIRSNNPMSDSSNKTKSNPFQSWQQIKKPVGSDSMFASFAKEQIKSSASKDSIDNTKKRMVFGKIQQNIHEQREEISEVENKKSIISNPFQDSNIGLKQKTNPFQSQPSERQDPLNISNPFSTGRSFLQRTNPFMQGSANQSRQINESQFINQPVDFFQTHGNKDIFNFDKSLDKSSLNPFTKKNFDFDFNFDEKQNKKQVSKDQLEFKKQLSALGQSAFGQFKASALKQDMFNEFVPTDNKSLFKDFPVLSHKPSSKVEIHFQDVKKSNIYPSKELAVSTIDFNWFDQNKDKLQIKEESHEKIQTQQNQIINLTKFVPPNIEIPTIVPTPQGSTITNIQEKQITDPYPNIQQLSESQWPAYNQVVQNPFVTILQQQKINEDLTLSKKSQNQIQKNPFGIPNPQFQQQSFQDLIRQKSPTNKKSDLIYVIKQNQNQIPTRDNDELKFEDFGPIKKEGGSPWNPFKKRHHQPQAQKNKLVLQSQLIELQRQLVFSKQFYNQQKSQNDLFKQEFITERKDYLSKLKQLQSLNFQKQQYNNLIKNSRQNIVVQEANIAQESKKVNQLKMLKDRKNQCLRMLFQIKSSRQSAKNILPRSSRNVLSKTNKFIAFNETARNLHSLATSGINSKQTFKIPSFHHH